MKLERQFLHSPSDNLATIFPAFSRLSLFIIGGMEKDDGFAMALFHEGNLDPFGIKIAVHESGGLSRQEFGSEGDGGPYDREDETFH